MRFTDKAILASGNRAMALALLQVACYPKAHLKPTQGT